MEGGEKKLKCALTTDRETVKQFNECISFIQSACKEGDFGSFILNGVESGHVQRAREAALERAGYNAIGK